MDVWIYGSIHEPFGTLEAGSQGEQEDQLFGRSSGLGRAYHWLPSPRCLSVLVLALYLAILWSRQT